MKTFTLLVLLVITCNSLIAQDLIVTKEKDSIHCYIYKEKKDFVHYSILENNKEIKVMIPMGRVLTIIYDFEKKNDHAWTPQNVAAQQQKEKEKENKAELPRNVYFSIDGGLSKRAGKISDALPAFQQEYLKKLKTGYNISADLVYYMFGENGLGFKYSYFNTQNSIPIQVTDVFGNYISGILSDNITVQYIGPAYYARYLFARNKLSLISGLSVGYIHFKDNGMLIFPLSMTGESVAVETDLGMDYYIVKNFGLGFKISAYFGALGRATIDDGTKAKVYKLPQPESLTRFDFSVGIRRVF